ncbi:39S ribosomal protein L10, mitochondrial [Trichinella zimbabwensis]|uniref:Large ribosomal subunit protein uL10m n=1 Tax=Trichinella zimbabwensis TaxID=268475 RepID=A0A0V1HQ41_9BILA|nr:39S ribosomal protein L10, mitochondrial [Trichinella zimbabwensis]
MLYLSYFENLSVLVRCFHATALNYSVKVSKPSPRHFVRRIFDEIAKPVTEDPLVLLAKRKQCKLPEYEKQRQENLQNLSPIEFALANCIRQKLRRARLLAICHVFPAKGRRVHIDCMRLAYNGFQPKVYNNRVMQHIIKDTSLANLAPLFCSKNQILLSDHPEKLVNLTEELKSVRWLKLLACVVDGRILTSEEVDSFSNKTFQDFAVQSNAALLQGIHTTCSLLDSAAMNVTNTFNELTTHLAK